MSVDDYIKETYRIAKSMYTLETRWDRMQYVKRTFLKDYGQHGVDLHFNGSRKALWFTIDELNHPMYDNR
jgi:hypothetical protein